MYPTLFTSHLGMLRVCERCPCQAVSWQPPLVCRTQLHIQKQDKGAEHENSCLQAWWGEGAFVFRLDTFIFILFPCSQTASQLFVSVWTRDFGEGLRGDVEVGRATPCTRSVFHPRHGIIPGHLSTSSRVFPQEDEVFQAVLHGALLPSGFPSKAVMARRRCGEFMAG